MTEEELREKIGDIIYDYNMFTVEELADQILTLIKEAGWKSPDQIPNATICPKCNEMHWIK